MTDQSHLQPNLFDSPNPKAPGPPSANIPLAHAIRPKTLDQFVGQEHLLAEGQPLRRAIEQDQIPSAIFWGPPGCGKTSLAHIIANRAQSPFQFLNAGTTGVPELRKLLAVAENLVDRQGLSTILFLDEIHRFNKAQQDFLLSSVEGGILILIGATTENPSFEINAALLSRLQVYTFQSLSDQHIDLLIQRALTAPDNGLGRYQVDLTDDGLEALIHWSAGDIRQALNALQLAVQTIAAESHPTQLDAQRIQEVVQKRILAHDKSGDSHYNLISALIKSLRASDPDAALYWLARLLESGEEARFIARRMVILASEDIGMADPQALLIADAAARAVEYVGLPEAELNLAHAAVYLACSPKSNAAYQGLLTAKKDVREKPVFPVPLHLRNAPTSLMKDQGYGQDYRYDHDFEDGIAGQSHLPEELKERRYYHPTQRGYEQQVQAYLSRVAGKRNTDETND
jgi:putative ATPase